MAQDQFVNLIVDPAASKKTDVADCRHTVKQAAASANDFTVSFDSTKILTVSVLDSCYAAARKIISGQMKP